MSTVSLSGPVVENQVSFPAKGLRLLLISPWYPPSATGSARLLRDIVDELVSNGHTVDVLTYAFESAELNAAFDQAQPYHITRVSPRRPGGISSIITLREVLRRGRTSRYDGIVCGVGYPSAIIAGVASKILGIPYAVYSHGEDVTCVEGSRVGRRLLSWALRRSRVVMANSNFTLGTARQLGVSDDRLFWRPPGIDPAPYASVANADVETLRRRWGLAGKRVILTLARLEARKGHDTVVRALPVIARQAPDVHYIVVGKGDPSPLIALADEHGVSDRLTIVPFVDDNTLPALFRLADVYVMVSRWNENAEVEGFGIVYLEAAACGRPSVAANVGGARDAVVNGVTGLLVDPKSPEAVAEAVGKLLSNPELASAMGEAGQCRVRKEFDKSATFAAIRELIVESFSRVG